MRKSLSKHISLIAFVGILVMVFALAFVACEKNDQQYSSEGELVVDEPLYTINFDLNGGRSNTRVLSKKVSKLDVDDFFFNVEKSGYIFRGWLYNGKKVFDENGKYINYVSITDNMTFVADWDSKAKLDISINMPEAGTAGSSGKYDMYSFVDVSATVNQGYVFVGWYNEDGIPLSHQLTYRYQMGDSDIELFAIYELDFFTLYVESNNGYNGAVTINPPNESGATIYYNESASDRIEYKDSVTIAALTKTGSRFLGWFDASGKLVSTNAVYTFKMPNFHYFLVAKWDYFTITYNLNGGTNNEHNPPSYTLSTPTIQLEDPTNGEKYFVGWKLGNRFVTEIDTRMAENITLTAVWEAYTISTNTNIEDAGTFTSTKTVLPGNNTIVTANTNPGYTWLGWYDGDTLLTDELSYTFIMPKDNIAYTAKWTYYTLSTDTNLEDAGAYTICSNKKVTAGESITLTAETNPGYTWLGWYDGDTLLTDELSYTFTMPKENVVYTAKWTYYEFTTEANIADAGTYTQYADNIVTVGESVTVTASTNPGYTWLGWYDGDTLLTDELSYTFTMPKDNVVYTAKWIPCPVSLGKNIEQAGNVDGDIYGKTVLGADATITANTNLGYIWLGWYDGDTLLTDELSYTFTMPRENVVYTAKWDVTTEMSNFNFTSTSTTCSITGIKDKTVAEIVVPNYVTTISNGSFAECASLVNLTLPFIGGSASGTTATLSTLFGYIFGTSSYTGGTAVLQKTSKFNNTSTTYYIPSTLRNVTITGGNILGSAFYNCSMLTSVTISDSITRIDSEAFYGCSSLERMTIPIISQLGYYFGTNSYAGGTAVEHSSSTTYYIPSTLRNVTVTNSDIPNKAFYNCSMLRSITMGNGVTRIGELAFYRCSGLTSITISESVISIDEIFGNIGYNKDVSIYYTGSVADWCAINGLGNLMTKVNAVLYIQDERDFNIPNGVTSISEYAFYGCTGLTSITIPDSVTSIGSYAFSGCTGLTSITIPDNITNIDNGLFYKCSNLTSVTISSSVTNIDSQAFARCSGLISINYTGTIAQWNAISKRDDSVIDQGNWNYGTGAYTIHCTDGDIAKA